MPRGIAAWAALEAAVLFVAPVSVLAADGTCGGVRFPSHVRVEGKALVRNGMGIRRATLFNVHVYVAALYVERPSHDPSVLMRGDQVRSLTLHFVRDVSRDDMLEALEDGLRANAPSGASMPRKEMKRLERMLPPLREGNELTFRHVPGQGLSVLGGAKPVGRIASDAFASALFRVWLGAHPPDTDLKAGLLGGKCD